MVPRDSIGSSSPDATIHISCLGTGRATRVRMLGLARPRAALAWTELAKLSLELDERLPGARWCIEVVEGRLVQPPATDDEIVKAARQLLAQERVGTSWSA